MLAKVTALLKLYMPDPAQEIRRELTLLGDLGLKSMDLINAIADFEDTFNISIPDNDLRVFRSVGDVLDYLISRGVCE